MVAASIVEQPDRIKSTPNRFYSEGEAEQYQQDIRLLQMVMFAGFGGAEPGQSGSDDEQQEITQELTAVAGRITAAKDRQAAAFVNQERLSLTLKVLGIIALAIGAVLLLAVRHADRGGRTSVEEAALNAEST